MKEKEWGNSKWIWCEDAQEKDGRVIFQKTIWIDTIPQSAWMNIAAETKYWLWINGQSVVSEGSLFRESTPGNGYYDAVDIASYLKLGKNVLTFFCWYYGNEGRNNTNCKQAGLRFFCQDLSLISDHSTLCMRHPAYYPPQGNKPSYLYGGYDTGFDAQKDIGAFWSADFTNDLLCEAQEMDETVYGIPVRRPIPLLRFHDVVIGQTLSQWDHTYRLRLPYAMAFTPYFEVEAQGGEVIWICSDRYEVPGGPGDSMHTYRGHRLEYRCKKGLNQFDSLYYLFGEEIICSSSHPLKNFRIGYRETGYDCDIVGAFTCSCPVTTRLVQKAARTLVCCMRDNFMDCPDRERGQWIGDVSVQTPQVFFLLSESAQLLVQKTIHDFLRLRKGDRLVGNVPGAHFSELPAQSLAAISQYGLFGQYEKYSGKQDFFAEALAPCIAYLSLWEMGENGLVLPRQGDWRWFDHLYNQDEAVLENAWYYCALTYCAHMVDVLNEHQYDAFLNTRMESIRLGFETQFWKGDAYRSGDWVDDRANAMAVLSGLCPKSRYPIIKQILTSVLNASVYMESFVLTALCEMGSIEEAYRRMVSRYYPLAMNENSTLWEDFSILGTKNHAWSGAPATIAFRYFMGIDTTDGFSHITVSPQRALFGEMACRFYAKGGMISIQVHQDGTVTIDNQSQSECKLLIEDR